MESNEKKRSSAEVSENTDEEDASLESKDENHPIPIAVQAVTPETDAGTSSHGKGFKSTQSDKILIDSKLFSASVKKYPGQETMAPDSEGKPLEKLARVSRKDHPIRKETPANSTKREHRRRDDDHNNRYVDSSSGSSTESSGYARPHKTKAKAKKSGNSTVSTTDYYSDEIPPSNFYMMHWTPEKSSSTKGKKVKSKPVDNFQSLIDTSSDSSSDSDIGSKKSGRNSACPEPYAQRATNKTQTETEPELDWMTRTYEAPSTSTDTPKPKKRQWPPSRETVSKRSSDSLYDYDELLTQQHIKLPDFDPSWVPPPDVPSSSSSIDSMPSSSPPQDAGASSPPPQDAGASSPPPPDIVPSTCNSCTKREHSQDRRSIRFSPEDDVKYIITENIDKGNTSRKRPYAVNRKVLKSSATEEDEGAKSCPQGRQPPEGGYHDGREKERGSSGVKDQPIPAPRPEQSPSDYSIHIDIGIYYDNNFPPDPRDVELVDEFIRMNNNRADTRREARRPVPTPRVGPDRTLQSNVIYEVNPVRLPRRLRFVRSVRKRWRRINAWFSRCWDNLCCD